jgi:hypothetical protein
MCEIGMSEDTHIKILPPTSKLLSAEICSPINLEFYQ